MKYSLYILIFLYSCRGSDKEILPSGKIAQLEKNFRATMISVDSTYRLDSFKFIRLDTITARERIGELIEDKIEEINQLNTLIESQNDVAASRIKLAQMYGYFSNSLSKMNNDEARDDIAKSEEYIQKSTQAIREQDSLFKIYYASDSVKAVAYNAINTYQIRKSDESVLRDTTRILLNLNLDIITREEFLK